jgi:hypothetical protein
LEQTEKIIDNIGAYSDKYYAPTGYKSQLDSYNGQNMFMILDRLERLMYEVPFSSPKNISTKAINTINVFLHNMNQYYDPKAKRLAEEARENFLYVRNSISSGVKSNDSWNNPDIPLRFEVALEKASQLKRYVENIVANG